MNSFIFFFSFIHSHFVELKSKGKGKFIINYNLLIRDIIIREKKNLSKILLNHCFIVIKKRKRKLLIELIVIAVRNINCK